MSKPQSEMSARELALDAMRRFAGEVHGGRYFVKRGWIHWGTFPFDAHWRGFSIQVDRAPFVVEPGAPGEMEITFELAASMPEGEEPGFDDGVQEEMIEDARWVVERAAADQYNGDTMFALLRGSRTVAEEFHDASDRVQGVVASFRIKYH